MSTLVWHVFGRCPGRAVRQQMQDGGTLLIRSAGRVIGPAHAGVLTDGGVDRLSFHFYDGDRNGRATLGIRSLRWSDDGWPEIVD